MNRYRVLLIASFISVLGLSVWSLADVDFEDVTSSFSAGEEVSATAFNDLFGKINDNFAEAKVAIDRLQSGLFVGDSGSVGVGSESTDERYALDVDGWIRSKAGFINSANPNNLLAGVSLGWENNIARIRVGGDGLGVGNGFQIQSVNDKVLLSLDNSGNTSVSASLDVKGNLTKGSGSFKIDHPLDPTNKYLYHSFVESPDMMNVYNGNVITDAAGFAIVTLPDYFEALNRDFRYQLTVIGDFAQAIVAQKIANNQFVIQTDKPNVEVSWQVTGIRQDAYAVAHPLQVEVLKPRAERGTYLHPEAYEQAQDAVLARVIQEGE